MLKTLQEARYFNAGSMSLVHRLSNVYVATTVLSLDWAYSNARLIARPDTEWLDP